MTAPFDRHATVDALARLFVGARQDAARLRMERNRHRCEEASTNWEEFGDPDVPECWRQMPAPEPEHWCEPCRQRQAAHVSLVRARKHARATLRRLTAAVRRGGA